MCFRMNHAEKYEGDSEYSDIFRRNLHDAGAVQLCQ